MINFLVKVINRISSNSVKRKICIVGDRSFFWRSTSVVGGEFIHIGNDFHGGKNLKLQTWKTNGIGIQNTTSPQLIIGNECSVQDNCQISCSNRIRIGDGCLLGDNVMITDNSHGSRRMDEKSIPPINRALSSKGEIEIGDNVWICRNVVICGGGCPKTRIVR